MVSPPQSLDQHDKGAVAGAGEEVGQGWAPHSGDSDLHGLHVNRGRSSECTSSVGACQAPRSRLLAAEEPFVMEIPWIKFNPENNPNPGPPCSLLCPPTPPPSNPEAID